MEPKTYCRNCQQGTYPVEEKSHFGEITKAILLLPPGIGVLVSGSEELVLGFFLSIPLFLIWLCLWGAYQLFFDLDIPPTCSRCHTKY